LLFWPFSHRPWRTQPKAFSGVGVEKVLEGALRPPCESSLAKRGPVLKIAYKFARGCCARVSAAEENADGRLGGKGEGYP
jgi:hypothetical protein